MNRLINGVLKADDKGVARILAEAGIEELLLQRWGDGHESALSLAFRLATTPSEKKSKASFDRIVASLKQAFQMMAAERVPLPEAVLSGRADAIESQLASAPPTEANANEYQTAIAFAVSIGDLASTRRFLEVGIDVETRFAGQSLLMIACENGLDSVVELLLKHKADPNARVTMQPGLQGATVLMIAAACSNLKILEKLIAEGADPTLTDSSGRSAREMSGNKKVRASLDAAAQAANHANLHEAINADAVPSVRRLLSQGVDLAARNGQGDTPIMLALKIGNLAVIQLLVDAGASLDFAEVWTCALADRKGKEVPALVAHLRALGVDSTRRNANNLPPLFLNGDPAVLRALLDAGADPHAGFRPSITWQDIKIEAIQLSVASAESHRIRDDASLDEMLTSLTQGFEVMNQQMVVAEYLKDKSEAFFEDAGQNRTEENSNYFELYARAKTAALAHVQKMSALDYYKLYCNRKACQFLREYLGTTKDAYDLAAEELKERAKNVPPDFQGEVERLSEILGAKPQPWKKRKGVIHFAVALHKTLPGFFQAESESSQLTPSDSEYGFEPLLLARLQADVRNRGFTLIWTEKRWNDRPLTRLLLFPSSNDLTVLLACGTNRNTGDDSREVVNWCDAIRRVHPFSVLGAGFDSMELGFQRPISQSADLAREILAFCPEFGDSPTDDRVVAELSQDLEAKGRCFFWWD